MQSIKRQMSRRKPVEDNSARPGPSTASPQPSSSGTDPKDKDPAGSPSKRKPRSKLKSGSKTSSMLRLPTMKRITASPPTSPPLDETGSSAPAVEENPPEPQPQQSSYFARASPTLSQSTEASNSSPFSGSNKHRSDDDMRRKLAGLFFWDKKRTASQQALASGASDDAHSPKSSLSGIHRDSIPSLTSHHSRTKSDSASLASHHTKPRIKFPERRSERLSSESSESGRAAFGSASSIGIGPRQSRSGSGGGALSLGVPTGRSKPRLSSIKNKAASVGRSSRDSVGSSSSQGSMGNTTQGIPFPTIRSQSSFGEAASRRESEPRPRRRTEGDVSIENPGSGSVGFGSSSPFFDGSAPRSATPAWHQGKEPAVVDEPLPERLPDMTPEAYAELLQEHAPAGSHRWRKVCVQLAQDVGQDPIRTMVAYLASHFSFGGEPVDMSLRKFLLYITLPGETQQIERVLQAFSELYNSHNPEAFTDAEQVLFIVFSLVILHTDTFNRNIRHKMSKRDYVQSTYSEGIPIEILEYLYDNITCLKFQKDEAASTPAIAGPPGYYLGTSVISTLDISRERSNGGEGIEETPSEGTTSRRSTISMSMPWNSSSGNSSSGGYDIYSLLLNNRLDVLRPNIEVLPTLGDYDAGGAAGEPLYSDTSEEVDVRATKIETTSDLEAVLSYYFGGQGGLYSLQLMSPRSRPDAYIEKLLREDGLLAEELFQKSRPGVVEVRVVKYGLILRPEPKRMLYPAKPGWREWGAILTESQLYLLRSTSWIRTALESKSTSEALRPPAELLASATVLPTVDLAALPMLSTQQQHPQMQNQFMLVTQGSSLPIWISTPYEQEYTDWIRLLNVTATFATFHIPAPYLELDPSQESGDPQSQPHLQTQQHRTIGHHARTSSATVLDQPQITDEIRMSILVEQIREVDRRLESVQSQIDENRRTLRHLKLLAPIQQRTRESVMYSAGLYASKLESCCLSRRKLRCYKHIMELDMRVLEMRIGSNTTSSSASSSSSDSFVDVSESAGNP